MILVFANAVNTSFSYRFFYLLYKHYIIFNFLKVTWFWQCIDPILPEFSQVQKVGGVTLPLYTPSCYFVLGSNFVRRWNGKAAREQRKNGMGHTPKNVLCSYTLERQKMPLFKRDGGYFDH